MRTRTSPVVQKMAAYRTNSWSRIRTRAAQRCLREVRQLRDSDAILLIDAAARMSLRDKFWLYCVAAMCTEQQRRLLFYGVTEATSR